MNGFIEIWGKKYRLNKIEGLDRNRTNPKSTIKFVEFIDENGIKRTIYNAAYGGIEHAEINVDEDKYCDIPLYDRLAKTVIIIDD